MISLGYGESKLCCQSRRVVHAVVAPFPGKSRANDQRPDPVPPVPIV